MSRIQQKAKKLKNIKNGNCDGVSYTAVVFIFLYLNEAHLFVLVPHILFGCNLIVNKLQPFGNLIFIMLSEKNARCCSLAKIQSNGQIKCLEPFSAHYSISYFSEYQYLLSIFQYYSLDILQFMKILRFDKRKLAHISR